MTHKENVLKRYGLPMDNYPLAEISRFSHIPLPILEEVYHQWVDAKSVLEFFNGLNNFIFTHNEQAAYFYQKDWPLSKLE